MEAVQSLCKVAQLAASQYIASPFHKPVYLAWSNITTPATAARYFQNDRQPYTCVTGPIRLSHTESVRELKFVTFIIYDCFLHNLTLCSWSFGTSFYLGTA